MRSLVVAVVVAPVLGGVANVAFGQGYVPAESPTAPQAAYLLDVELVASFREPRFNEAHILSSLGSVEAVAVEPPSTSRVQVGDLKTSTNGANAKLTITWPARHPRGKISFSLAGKSYVLTVQPRWSSKGHGRANATVLVSDPTWVVVRGSRLMKNTDNESLIDITLQNPTNAALTIPTLSLSAMFVEETGHKVQCNRPSPWETFAFHWTRSLSGRVLGVAVTGTMGDQTVKAVGHFQSLACSGKPTGSYRIDATLPAAVDLRSGDLAHLRFRLRDVERGISMFAAGGARITKCQTVRIDFPADVRPRAIELSGSR